MKEKTKKLTMLAMICAFAYVVMVVGRIPVVLFLKYDPKDVVITIGGFLLGPMAAFGTSLLVSLLEMFTVSDTGFIGMVMNLLSTCSFACVAAMIYKKKHTIAGALLGLAAGCLTMAAVMVLWNYFITPIYMGYPREKVAEMLLPMFLPFNLLKGGLNGAITMLVYKPVATGLRKANLISASAGTGESHKINTGVMLASSVALATCVLFVLVMKGVL